jgi:DNA-binding IclR family transcriptional regulator
VLRIPRKLPGARMIRRVGSAQYSRTMSTDQSQRGTGVPRANRTVGAESSRKLLHALLAFDEVRPAWTVPGLAAHLGVPQSTMYRYIALLREVGLVDSSGGGEYRLTERVVGLSRGVVSARASLIELARPHIEHLRDEIDETVLISRRGGAYAYCVDRVESRHPVRLQFDPGQAMSIHRGSTARVLLANMPRGERDAIVSERAPSLPEERRAMLTPQALDEVRRAGWTESFEEVDDGIWGVAAAVTKGNDVVAAVGTAGPMFRLDERRRADIIAKVRSTANRISAELG